MLAAIYVLSIRNTAGDKSGQHKLKPVPTKAVELPSSYERPSGEPGHVEEISYKTTLIDGSGRVVDMTRAGNTIFSISTMATELQIPHSSVRRTVRTPSSTYSTT